MTYKPPSFAPKLHSQHPADYEGPLATLVPGNSLRQYSSPTADRLSDLETHRMALYSGLESTNVLVAMAEKTSGLENICEVHIVEDLIWTGLLITYARCFDGKSSPNPLVASDYLSDSDLDAHRILIELRNKHAAHDINRYRASSIAVEISESGELLTTTVHHLHMAYTKEQIFAIGTLLQEAHEHSSKLCARLRTVVENELADLQPEQRLQLPEMIARGIELSDVTKNRRGKRGR